MIDGPSSTSWSFEVDIKIGIKIRKVKATLWIINPNIKPMNMNIIFDFMVMNSLKVSLMMQCGCILCDRNSGIAMSEYWRKNERMNWARG